MHFGVHFPKENVQQNKMYASLFFAKQKTQHFCTAFVFCCAKNTAAQKTKNFLRPKTKPKDFQLGLLTKQ